MSALFDERAPGASAPLRIRVWDLPVRVVHWSLVAAVTTAIVTGELGGPWMTLHGKAGLAIVGLVAFRLVWGVMGSTHARFVNFLPTPRRIADYVRGRWRGVGHNPLGALSVVALLALLTVQAVTGLFGNDDIAFNGPLFHLVSDDLSAWLTGWHRRLANLLIAVVAVHVLAIVVYVSIKKHTLVKPMLTGWKAVDEAQAVRGGGPIALAVSIAAAGAAVLAASGGWSR